ncbi:MAG TPA: hypothetical protein O0X27_05170 [Methanocorpusculum sp.]|nr:hypothetical protein [Methanocorpusculum sp.]
MPAFDFTVKEKTGVDLITFGTSEKKVTIDVTFIPAAIGYRMKDLLVKDEKNTQYTPDKLADLIALFTDEVDAAWIVENTDYGTLDQIVAIIINKAFGRRPEKN